MIDKIQGCVNGDKMLIRRGRFVDLAFLLGVGDEDYLVTIEKGRIASIEPRELETITGQFSIRAASEVWQEFWKPMPKRNHHDIWAMLAAGLVELDGDLAPLMQNLQYFKDVLSSPRPKARRR
ncbi:MAG: hypothetical protein QF654_04825 [Alphaproteobacteria bacterium]|jgi:hypothetical protein|nr:hypothetical protein [Alphaproteobacteria bacterium]